MRTLTLALFLAAALHAQPASIATLAAPARPSSFVLARNGRVAAAVCGDKELRIWNLPEAKVRRSIPLAGRQIDIVAISEDGSLIAMGDHTGDYTVWDTAAGTRRLAFHLPYYPFALAFSPDAKRLAVAPAGEPVQILDVTSGKKLFELQRPVGGTASVAFSRDNARIAAADTDTVVRVYDARNGELLTRYTDFLLEPLAAAFTADGKRVVAAGGDKFISFVDTASGSAALKSDKLVDPVAYLDVSPDGAFTAAALMHSDNLLQPAPVVIMDTATGRKVQEWTPTALAIGGGWIADGHLLVATATDKELTLWRVR